MNEIDQSVSELKLSMYCCAFELDIEHLPSISYIDSKVISALNVLGINISIIPILRRTDTSSSTLTQGAMHDQYHRRHHLKTVILWIEREFGSIVVTPAATPMEIDVGITP